MKKIKERNYDLVLNSIRELLLDSTKDLGVRIESSEIINPLKNIYEEEEILYTIRHILEKGYMDYWTTPAHSEYKLTIKGFEEWLLPFGHENSKKIFISHADEDKDMAKTIKVELENPKFGFTVFLAHDDIPVSELFRDKLISELYTSGTFIILRTKKYNEKSYTEQECGFALALKKRIITLCIETEPSDMGFCSAIQSKKFDKWDEKKIIDYCIKQLVNSEDIV